MLVSLIFRRRPQIAKFGQCLHQCLHGANTTNLYLHGALCIPIALVLISQAQCAHTVRALIQEQEIVTRSASSSMAVRLHSRATMFRRLGLTKGTYKARHQRVTNARIFQHTHLLFNIDNNITIDSSQQTMSVTPTPPTSASTTPTQLMRSTLLCLDNDATRRQPKVRTTPIRQHFL